MTTFEPGREARLHPRPPRQARLDGLAGQQPGAEHDRRVRRVRAARDRGDHHRAVVEALAVGVRADAGAPSPRCAGSGFGDTPSALLDGGSLAGNVSAADVSQPW